MAGAAQAVKAAPAAKMIGIQVGAVSFVDEGVEKVLDIFQESAGINTLFLATFTYGRGIAGRQIPGQTLPDHGKQEHDTDTFHGGSYTGTHPQYYKNTVIQNFRAPEFGDYDVLQAVLPSARRRRMKTICWFEDVFSGKGAGIPGIGKAQERRLDGGNAETLCFNNPNYRNWLLGTVEDYARSYEIDGIMWGSERQGAFANMLASYQDPAGVTCFCEFCEGKAKARGIDPGRAREGFRALSRFVQDARQGRRPVDGYYVTVWRLMLRHPEMLAWEMLWTDSLRETYAAMHQKVKEVKPSIGIGWHIWHNNSFNPIYRAEQDLAEISTHSDFLKMVMYHNCGGERMANYIATVGRTMYGDVPSQELLDFHYRVLDYTQEKGLAEIPGTGLSANYVYEEAKRARTALNGAATQLWPGIDIDIPTAASSSKSTPEGTRDAVTAAFRAGADGVILSRKYSEMKLANLRGAGTAIRELGLA
ncbi:MAG: hypothetical protein ACLPX8_00750 [Bryobacteraceae bacterium]